MSPIPARLGLVTLGVADLTRSIAFYEALGWERAGSSIDGVICWFHTADTNLGLFPYQDLADDAQMMVVMTQIKRVQAPDRDNTAARLAELELREMINSYPNSDLLEEAKEKLRLVQEVLSAGNFKIANQYLHSKNYKAAIDRYTEIELKYPDFSKMDEVLFNHAEALFFTESGDAAGKLYAEVVSDYPGSKLVKPATQRLMELSLPVPPPNPAAQPRPAPNSDKNVLGKTFSVFKSRPAVPANTTAASVGDKNGAFTIDSNAVKD